MRISKPLISTVLLAPVASFIVSNASFAAEAKPAPSKAPGKKTADKAQSPSGTGAAASAGNQNASESNSAIQLVRVGLSVELVNQSSISNLVQFLKVVEVQRSSAGLESVSNTLKACNSSERGADFIETTAQSVTSGVTLSSLVQFNKSIAKGDIVVSDASNFLTLVNKLGNTEANLLLKNLGDQLNSESRGEAASFIQNVSSDYEASSTTGGISDLLDQLTSVANGTPSTPTFRSSLTAEARTAYDALTSAQKEKFKALYPTSLSPAESLEISSLLENVALMEKFPSLLDKAASFGLSNPLLQEAATVGNALLKDQTWTSSQALSSTDAYTYDKLFPNGYNKALIALIASYSNNEKLVNAIDTFVTNGPSISNETLLSSIFTETGDNTNLLGLRKLSYIKPTEGNLNYSLSQGESFFSRRLQIGAAQGLEIDVTNTKVAEAGDTQDTSRMVTVAALGDTQISGKITVKNTNPDAATTRNVVVIGAINSLKVADNTEIINQGRILAVGAGKLQGANGTAITGLKLESKGAIAVGSGKDLHLVNATFTVGNTNNHLVMAAQKTMTVDNPTFNGFGNNSKVYMEATTVNLQNVNFPDGAKVRLVSRDGGTQDGVTGTGNYPRFGTPVVGRVNFISNVKYNSNPIGNTNQFDAHGANIAIRKVSGN